MTATGSGAGRARHAADRRSSPVRSCDRLVAGGGKLRILQGRGIRCSAGLLSVLLVAVIGCGGGGGGGSSAPPGGGTGTASGSLSSPTGQFDDGSPYVRFSLSGVSSGSTTITVASSADVLLDVESVNADGTGQVLAEAEGTAPAATFSVTSGTQYLVLVSGDAGSNASLKLSYPSSLLAAKRAAPNLASSKGTSRSVK